MFRCHVSDGVVWVCCGGVVVWVCGCVVVEGREGEGGGVVCVVWPE